MSSVNIFNTADGGEINVTNGQIQTRPGLESATYLSMFGGNLNEGWWGNESEDTPSRQYRGETEQFLINNNPSISNLNRLREAINRDLAWLIQERIASKIDISLTLERVNRLTIVIDISAIGERMQFSFPIVWEASV